jgi:S-adenosylmethionine synthetase
LIVRPDARARVCVSTRPGSSCTRHVVSPPAQGQRDARRLQDYVISEIIKSSRTSTFLQDEYFINPTASSCRRTHGDYGLTDARSRRYTAAGASRGGPSPARTEEGERSAAYFCRWVPNTSWPRPCGDLRASGRLRIGLPNPTQLRRNFGTNTVPQEKSVDAVKKTFTSSPRSNFRQLDFCARSTVPLTTTPLRQGDSVDLSKLQRSRRTRALTISPAQTESNQVIK